MEILQWLIDNLDAVLAGAGLILAGLAILAKLTPNPQDDKWIGKIIEFLKLAPKSKK